MGYFGRVIGVVAVAVAVVEQTIYSIYIYIYNIIVGRGGRGMRVSSRRGAHFGPFCSSRLGKVMSPQNRPLANKDAKT